MSAFKKLWKAYGFAAEYSQRFNNQLPPHTAASLWHYTNLIVLYWYRHNHPQRDLTCFLHCLSFSWHTSCWPKLFKLFYLLL